jgi:N-acetylglucosamine-6-phosphate deacetylase
MSGSTLGSGKPHTLTARRLLTARGEVEYPVVEIAADGTIADISSDPKACAGETDTLTCAFLDVHNHGARGYDVMTATPSDLSEMQRFLAAHGTAYYLPTTVTASIDATLHALERLADAIERAASNGNAHSEAQPIGIHLEGPFLSHAKRGVHPSAHLQAPSIALFERFRQAARNHIRLVTIAPEPAATANAPYEASSDTALDLIAHCTKLGVRVSLGHTNATAAETLAAIEAGASSATHTFNAMRPLDHREPGVLGIVLDDDRLYAELICDGIHVAPPLVRLWLRAKERDGLRNATAAHRATPDLHRAILVTDAMSATGMPDGNYALGGLAVTVRDGRAVLAEDLKSGRETLAGSLLTLDRAVKNLQSFTGCDLSTATRAASHTPAAMLGQPERTRLSPGTPAHLNRFDAAGRLIATYLNGEPVAR